VNIRLTALVKGLALISRLHFIGSTPVGSLYAYDVVLEFAGPHSAKNPASTWPWVSSCSIAER